MGLRLAFFGTPAFAVDSLRILAENGYTLAAVFTQPDRPKGRGGEPGVSAVKQAALALGLPVHQPERIRRPEAVELLRGLGVDAMVVVGYGQILPQAVLDLAPMGIVNVHASLLPAYRGAAPIQWAIANGETRTGVTTMRIDAGMDTGDILLERETAIGPEETAPELSARLAREGAGLLLETMRGLEAGAITPRPQDNALASYAPILTREDGRIDWSWPARKIHCRLRGFDPWPGAYTTFRGHLLHVRAARPAPEAIDARPGTLRVEGARLLAACGEASALELRELQQEGRKRVSAEAFRHGQRLQDNEVLGESGS